MKVIYPDKGQYLVAVSGGVDSMVLLNLLVQQPDLELVVAHFDHSMRSDSQLDCDLVAKTAKSLGLKFVSAKAKPGELTSEASARTARYKFLDKVKSELDCDGVVTAHHQDDVIETMIINLMRGTSWRGLVSLKSTDDRVRPLLDCPKSDLVQYAQQNNLEWREDPTNQSSDYLRNQVRNQLLPRITKSDPDLIDNLLEIRTNLLKIESELNSELDDLIKWLGGENLDRTRFNQLPHSVAKEVAAQLLRIQRNHDKLNTRHIEGLVHFAKTAKVGKQHQVGAGIQVESKKQKLSLTRLV